MTLKQLGAFILAVFLMLLFFVSPDIKAHDKSTGWIDLWQKMIAVAIERGEFFCYRDECTIVGCLDELPDALYYNSEPETESAPKRWSVLRNGTESTIVYYSRCSEI